MKKIFLTLIICLFFVNNCNATQIKENSNFTENDINKIYLTKGLNYYDLKQYNKALKYINKSLEINSKQYNVIMLKISILETLGKRKDAIVLAKQTIRQIPDNARLNEMLGGLLVLNGDYDEGIKYLQIAAKLNPDRAIIHSFLGKAYANKYDFDKAIEEYSKAINLNPKNIENYIARAKAYGDKSDWKHTLDDYKTLIKMHPNNYNLYFIASLYQLNLKDYNAALSSIDRAIELAPQQEACFYSQKSWVYLELHDTDNACKYAKMALDIDANDQYTNEMLAMLAYENKNYKLALQASNKALKHSKTVNPAPLVTRAKILYKLGKYKQAIKTIDMVIQYMPYDKEYAKLKEKMLNRQEIE